MAKAKHECYGCGEILTRDLLRRVSISRESTAVTRVPGDFRPKPVRVYRSSRNVWMCADCSANHVRKGFLGLVGYGVMAVLVFAGMGQCAKVAGDGSPSRAAPEAPPPRTATVEAPTGPDPGFVETQTTAPADDAEAVDEPVVNYDVLQEQGLAPPTPAEDASPPEPATPQSF
jgi:hypothetical protein